MRLFVLPKSTRGQVMLVAVHVTMLVVPLALAWKHDGPPPEKAFWLIFAYFVEIGVLGTIDLILGIIAVRGR